MSRTSHAGVVGYFEFWVVPQFELRHYRILQLIAPVEIREEIRAIENGKKSK
jgi:hypothetical protein